ncbi:hypothetical protein D3C75_826460 [compost metagenome]
MGYAITSRSTLADAESIHTRGMTNKMEKTPNNAVRTSLLYSFLIRFISIPPYAVFSLFWTIQVTDDTAMTRINRTHESAEA